MANELDVIGFNTTTPTTTFGGKGSTRGISELRESSQKLSGLISEKLQAFQVDQAIKQGQEDAMAGKTPKTLAPSGFNAVTQAYNQSVLQSTGEMFKQDYTVAKEGLDEALATGNTEGAKQYGSALNQMIDWYAERHPDIKMGAAGLKRTLAEDVLIGKHVGEYTQLGPDTSAGNAYLADFISNPPEGLTVAQQQKAAKKMWDVRNTQSHLQSQAQAEQLARYENDMVRGLYPTTEEIMADPVLSNIQKLKLDTEVKQAEARAMAIQLKIAQAQKKITEGNAGAIESKTKDAMFEQSNANFEAAFGRAPTMIEMAMNIAGTSPTPTSGLSETSLDTNVRQFDSIIASNISSGDAARQLDAVTAYNYLVNDLNKPNLINLSGEEANFAVTGSILMNGGDIPGKEIMDKLNKAIYQVSEPERKIRRDRFNKDIARTLPKKFKEVFNVKPGDAENDVAQGYFNNLYSTNYMISGDVESALQTTAYMMRGWGKSKYTPDEGVVFAPPEKTYPLEESLPDIVNNQIKYRTQELIDSNPNIEWAEKPERRLNLKELTEEELVYLPIRTRHSDAPYYIGPGAFSKESEIRVNGHQSKVYLVPGPDVLNNASGNPVYQMYYQDRYGNFLPLQDPNDSSGVAKVSLKPLEQWAPQTAQEEGGDLKFSTLNKARRRMISEKFSNMGMPKPLSNVAAFLFNAGINDPDEIDDLREEIGNIVGKKKKDDK